jgi:hypothetical protein
VWRPTARGVHFTLGYFKVKSHVVLYRNRIERFEGDDVGFDEVVNEFDYQELMSELGGMEKDRNAV